MICKESLPLFKSSLKQKKKSEHINYQDILYEYFKMLLSSKNILRLVSKEIKTKFFMNMNDIMVNKHDELKYLVLMKENFRKYKLKTNYFLRWKKIALVNEDSIKENDGFENNVRLNYNLFKSVNSFSGYPSLKKININNRNISMYRYNSDSFENDYIYKEKNSNIINNWKNNLIACKINEFYLTGNFNTIKTKKIFKNENFNFNIKGFSKIKNSIHEENKELKIDNFRLNYINHNNNKNIFNNKTNNYNKILRIIKGKELEIINKNNEENKKFKIIENGLNNGQEHTLQNFEINENDEQILRNKNKNNKSIKNKINDLENPSNNKNNEDNKFVINLLLVIIIILLVSMIINGINIDNF